MPKRPVGPSDSSHRDGSSTDEGRQSFRSDAREEELVLPFPECVIDENGRRQLPTLLDELNTTRFPIGLAIHHNASVQNHSLKSDGSRLLEAFDGRSLPTAHATRVFVGLLNLYRDADTSYASQSFEFRPRRLVEDYIYPNRGHRASAKEIGSVVEQIDRIAHTRIHTDAWHARSGRGKGMRVTVNASLIDEYQIIHGSKGRNPTIVKITWGKRLWESLRGRFTKPLDAEIYYSISGHIALSLYRFIDAQLRTKRMQRVRSIQQFARELGMRSTRLDRGGRTASTYAAKSISNAVSQLQELGYAVKVEIDRKSKDFSLTFIRDEPATEVVRETKSAIDLLHCFEEAAHGVTNHRRRSFGSEDVSLAQAWVTEYDDMNAEALDWLVSKAVALYAAKTNEKPNYFRALARVQSAARAAWEKYQSELEGQKTLPFSVNEDAASAPLPSYDDYVLFMTRRAQETEPETDQRLVEAVQADLEKESGWSTAGEHMRSKWLDGALKEARIQAYALMNRFDYEGWSKENDLDSELINRHNISLAQLRAQLASDADNA